MKEDEAFDHAWKVYVAERNRVEIDEAARRMCVAYAAKLTMFVIPFCCPQCGAAVEARDEGHTLGNKITGYVMYHKWCVEGAIKDNKFLAPPSCYNPMTTIYFPGMEVIIKDDQGNKVRATIVLKEGKWVAKRVES